MVQRLVVLTTGMYCIAAPKSGDTWGDTDISGEDASVQAVCNAVWTSAVKSAYETAMDAQKTHKE